MKDGPELLLMLMAPIAVVLLICALVLAGQ